MYGKRRKTARTYGTSSKDEGLSKPRSKTISTQTTPTKIVIRPLSIVLTKLDNKIIQEIGKRSKPGLSNEDSKPNIDEISLRNYDHASLVNINSPSPRLINRPEPLSRLPKSYNNFKKPITNNEKANSTLVNISFNEKEDAIKDSTEYLPTYDKLINNNLPKRVNFFIKPGPKCSKPSDYFIDDNRIPIMLDVSTKESTHSLLPTITERSQETVTPPLENLEAEDLSYEINDVGVQTEIVPTSDVQENVSMPNEENIENLPTNVMEKNTKDEANKEQSMRKTNKINNCDSNTANTNTNLRNQNLNNVDFTYETYATIITSTNNREENNSSSSSESEGSNRRKSKKSRKKYIKINAHTVHIHNHFYNN